MEYRGDHHGPRDRDEVIQMYSVSNPGFEHSPSPRNGTALPPFAVDMTSAGHQIPLDSREPQDDLSGSRKNWAQDSMRDTADLLSQLPSRQLEQVASGAAQSIRRKKTLRKSLHGTIRGRNIDDLAASLKRDDELMDELDGEMKTNEMLRGMNVKLSDKKRVKSQMHESRQQMTLQRGAKSLGWAKRTKYSLGIAWMHFKYRVAEVAYSLELWKSLLKKIEGHFGTGVTSYFLFLKWIFLLNIPIFILTFGFIVIPQILYDELQTKNPPVSSTGNSTNNMTTTTAAPVSFTGEELLTGGNYFNSTILYYGHYTDQNVSIIGDTQYDMKYAYLFTGGGYYILCLIIVALSISRSYKKNYIEASGTFNFYIVTKVFCGWDYNITAEDAAKLRHKSFCNEIKEFLSGKKFDSTKRSFKSKCKWFFIRAFMNLNVLAMIGGASYLIYFIQKNNSIKTSIFILGDMAMPLAATGIILILPFIFTLISRVESYVKPQTELYVGMLRTMLLKASILGILTYFWFHQAEQGDVCWETRLGQDIYRLVLVDFIFILLGTFFMEFFRGLLSKYCCKSLDHPEFDIGRNTLDLIYSQALCWLGTFYSPLLSLIMSLKLFIIFYVKAVSVLQNCKPSLRAWRASRTHTIFLGFLFFFFLLAAVAVGYGVILVKPSSTCGPFKGQDKAYDVVTLLVDSWKEKLDVLHTIVRIISSPGAIASVLVALCVGTYYVRILMVGHKEMVKLLRQQLAMEGRDKAYLLKMLQDASRERKEKLKPSRPNRLFSPTSPTPVETMGQTPGGRKFARTAAESSTVNSQNNTPVLTKRGKRF